MDGHGIFKRLQYVRLYIFTGLVLIGVVVWLSLAPISGMPEFQSSDKVGHVLAYMSLALWHSQYVRPLAPMAICCFALIMLGLGMEWAQSLTDYRLAEWGDVAANTLGVLIGAALGFTPLGRVVARIESELR